MGGMDVLSSHPAASGRQLRMESVHLARTLPIEKCSRAFVDRVLEAGKSDLCLGLGQGRVYLFSFGSAVFVDVDPAQIPIFVKDLLPLAEGPGEQASDDFLVELQPEGKERVAFDRMVLQQVTPAKLKLAALVLAQSTTLEHFEKSVEKLLDQASVVADSMASGSWRRLRSGEMLRYIGVGLSTRRDIVSRLSILDSPDIVWEDPGLDLLFNELRANFELQSRFRTLEYKLRLIHESAEVLVDLANTRRSAVLELTIIALIALEIVLALLEGH